MDRPSSSDQSDRSATKRSVQQSPVSRPVHSEHSTGHRSHRLPVMTWFSVPGRPVTIRYPVPGRPVKTGTQVSTGQKAQKVEVNQCLDQSELLVLNSPVRPVQLELNVHESLGNMPSVQDEHTSEHSQAFQGLPNSDSPDDRADESPERSTLRHSGHRSPFRS